MPIPSYDQLMLPVLQRSAEKVWEMRALVARIADDLTLTQEEREQEIPSGGQTLIANRVHWAKTFLKKAGLLEQPARGKVTISARGREILQSHPTKIDVALLQRFPEFRAFANRDKPKENHVLPSSVARIASSPGTPDDQLDAASETLNELLRDDLLARILEVSAASFERLIVDLLLQMGYGGSRKEAGEHLGRTGDGGVDGVIREDRLGLDRIFLQAKKQRSGNTVSSEAVQAFIGALIGQGAQKGVFITTSTFSNRALEVAKNSGNLRLVLIDGEALTKLMIQFGVGVRVTRTVEVKRIDEDYFVGIEAE